MSDEFNHGPEATFSAFVPLAILLVSLLIWVSYYDYEINQQRSALHQQLYTAKNSLMEAENYKQQYLSLIVDLNNTAQNDNVAKDIIKDPGFSRLINEAIRVGMIRPNTNTAPEAPAAPK